MGLGWLVCHLSARAYDRISDYRYTQPHRLASWGAASIRDTPLPEEGGPPGGVLGGHLFVDSDEDGVRDTAEHPVSGYIVVYRFVYVDGVIESLVRSITVADQAGNWEIRALPDGEYMVMQPQPQYPTDLVGNIPPLEEFPTVRYVEIQGASRVYDIDIGMPAWRLADGVTPGPTEDPGLPPPGPNFPPPTPLLPEEGGPPGGVAGGHLFIDTDRDGARSPADRPAAGQTILVFRIDQDEDDGLLFEASTTADAAGAWQIRTLPDGSYRALWDPPLRDPALLSQTIPPAKDVVLNPIQTVTRVTLAFEIKGANRVLDLDMGMPDEGTIAGAGAARPERGAGTRSWNGLQIGLLAAALAVSIGTASFLTLRRRRR